MKKLTNEQIKFIDDRLYNLGVEFIDIRYEMVDHIASALEEMEGDFGDNWHEYFIMNRLQLLEQNKKAKRTAAVRALKYYFKTLFSIVGITSAVVIFSAMYFIALNFIDPQDLMTFGLGVWLLFFIPMAWITRKAKTISVMRHLLFIQSFLYALYNFGMLFSHAIENRESRVAPQCLSIAVTTALMLVVIISQHRCRKQYVGKYI